MEPFSNSQNDVISLYDVIMTSTIAIFGPYWPDIAHLITFYPITTTFDTSIIPYPIWNSRGNLMAPFWNSQNDFFLDIWRHNDVKWSFCGPFWPDIAYLSYFHPITTIIGSNIIPYPRGNSPGNIMVPFWNSQMILDLCRYDDVKW